MRRELVLEDLPRKSDRSRPWTPGAV